MKPMPHPKISVITVCYNSGATLERTIRSVLSQDYPNIEYWIIDGASTDGTQALLARYASDIQGIVSEKDAGMYDAMNKGLTRVTGDIVGFLHADDVFYAPTVLSTVAATFLADPALDACYSDLIYQDLQQRRVRYWKSTAFKPGAFSYGWSPPHPTFYAKRTCYQQYGGFDLQYPLANDIEFMMRWMEKYPIRTAYVPEIWVAMTLGGISNQSYRNIWIQNQCILQALKIHGLHRSYGKYIAWKLWDRLRQRFQREEGQ